MPFSWLCCWSSNHVQTTHSVDEPHPVQKPPFVSDTPSKHSQSNHVTESSESTTAPPAVPAKAPASGTTKPAKNEPYTPARAESLFKQYADRDDANVIGAEGFEKLCADANVNLEGAQALIMAWQFNTGEMMKITKAEWTAGTGKLQVSSPLALSQAIKELDDLLMEGKPPVQQTTKKDTLYDRALYQSYVADPTSAFLKFYMFCFNLVKPAQSKNIEMETSVAFWSVLLVPKYPIMAEVLEFIKESGTTYKATNKDLWSMMLEFCRTVSPNLTDYEADGAWPTLLDDFVAWKRKKVDMSGDGAADAQ